MPTALTSAAAATAGGGGNSGGGNGGGFGGSFGGGNGGGNGGGYLNRGGDAENGRFSGFSDMFDFSPSADRGGRTDPDTNAGAQGAGGSDTFGPRFGGGSDRTDPGSDAYGNGFGFGDMFSDFDMFA